MVQQYSAEEVSRHNHEKDLWIVIHGGVYDLTKFLKEHPGGEEVLINLAGQDGTKCFDDIGHSSEAIHLQETFKIGETTGGSGSSGDGGGSKLAAERQPTVDDDDWVYEEYKPKQSPWLPIIVATAVVVYAVLFYYLLL